MRRRFVTLAGISFIAGGLAALFLFAASARAVPAVDLGSLLGGGGTITPAQTGSGAETTTSTTTGGSGSGATTTSTTTGGSTTTSTTTGGSTTSSSSTTSTTARVATITTNVQSVQQGGTVQVNGVNWPASTEVGFTLNSDPVFLGSVRSDSAGGFSVVLRIPSTIPVGTHTLTASGGGKSASLTLLVSAPLVVTGMSWNFAILGIALLAAGVIVLAGERIGRQELVEFV